MSGCGHVECCAGRFQPKLQRTADISGTKTRTTTSLSNICAQMIMLRSLYPCSAKKTSLHCKLCRGKLGIRIANLPSISKTELSDSVLPQTALHYNQLQQWSSLAALSGKPWKDLQAFPDFGLTDELTPLRARLYDRRAACSKGSMRTIRISHCAHSLQHKTLVSEMRDMVWYAECLTAAQSQHTPAHTCASWTLHFHVNADVYRDGVTDGANGLKFS